MLTEPALRLPAELEGNNNREWFARHKGTIRAEVR